MPVQGSISWSVDVTGEVNATLLSAVNLLARSGLLQDRAASSTTGLRKTMMMVMLSVEPLSLARLASVWLMRLRSSERRKGRPLLEFVETGHHFSEKTNILPVQVFLWEKISVHVSKNHLASKSIARQQRERGGAMITHIHSDSLQTQLKADKLTSSKREFCLS